MNEVFIFIFGLITTIIAIGPYAFIVISEQKSKKEK